MAIEKITAAEFATKVRGGKGECVVDFSATWCGPCRMLEPILEEISEERPDIAFYSVDVDKNRELAEVYSIMSVPAVFIFEDGEIKSYFIGLKTKEEVEKFL